MIEIIRAWAPFVLYLKIRPKRRARNVLGKKLYQIYRGRLKLEHTKALYNSIELCCSYFFVDCLTYAHIRYTKTVGFRLSMDHS